MSEKGFSLVEMIVVMAIIATILAIATLNFNQMTRKSNIEAQTRMMYADIMKARAESLLIKKGRSVVVTASTFSVYSSTAVTVGPLLQRTLKYPVTLNPTSFQIDFDTMGIASLDGAALCASTNNNPAGVDSIVVEKTRILMGKWKQGVSCSAANIDAK